MARPAQKAVPTTQEQIFPERMMASVEIRLYIVMLTRQ